MSYRSVTLLEPVREQYSHALVEAWSDFELLDLLDQHLGELVVHLLAETLARGIAHYPA